jgi:hypothetical protein
MDVEPTSGPDPVVDEGRVNGAASGSKSAAAVSDKDKALPQNALQHLAANLPASRLPLKVVVNILDAPECSSKTFHQALTLIQVGTRIAFALGLLLTDLLIEQNNAQRTCRIFRALAISSLPSSQLEHNITDMPCIPISTSWPWR